MSAISLAKSLIETVCSILQHIFIVIDGLDECQKAEDRKEIIDTFSDLVKTCDGQSQGKLRVLFLSRSDFQADRMSLPLIIDTFPLAPENNQKDIERYCNLRFEREHGLLKLGLQDQEVEAAVKITCLRANG